jgi:hypothetical protein
MRLPCCAILVRYHSSFLGFMERAAAWFYFAMEDRAIPVSQAQQENGGPVHICFYSSGSIRRICGEVPALE